ncbi:hypothetical protein V2J09_011060 [Rumex salicifolius]
MSAATVVSRLSSLRSKLNSIAPATNAFKSCSRPLFGSSPKRISCISRLPVESSFLLSMLPLHSAIASARLQSVLSVDSLSWCLVPQVHILIYVTEPITRTISLRSVKKFNLKFVILETLDAVVHWNSEAPPRRRKKSFSMIPEGSVQPSVESAAPIRLVT